MPTFLSLALALPLLFQEAAPTRADLVARDARTSFTTATAERARLFLDPVNAETAAFASDDQRGAALIAIGAGGDGGDVPLLETYAVSGRRADRLAAVLALGELGSQGLPALRRVGAGSVDGLEGPLLVAHLRAVETGTAGAPAALATLATRVGGPFAGVAQSFVGLTSVADTPDSIPAANTYYELRWLAARTYGLIDGRRWRDVRLDELARDERFLDAFVVSASGLLRGLGAIDHVVDLVRESSDLDVLAGAVSARPEAIARLVLEEGWEPAEGGWIVILEAEPVVLGAPSVGPLEGVLELISREHPPLAGRATLRIVRGGGEPPPDWMKRALANFHPQTWRILFEAAGDRGDVAMAQDLGLLVSRVPTAAEATPGWVALVRLGQPASLQRIEDVLRGEANELRAKLIQSLARVAYDETVARILDDAWETVELTEAERSTVLLGLANAGQDPDRAGVRAIVRRDEVPRELWNTVIHVLSVKANAADLTLFRELFPGAENWRKSLPAALGLLRNKDRQVRRLLRAALWGDSVPRGLLAGGVLWEVEGYHALLTEIQTPPPGASDERKRRVGFALGEFGGLPAVERLAADRDERDPYVQGAVLGALSREGSDGR